MQPQRNWQRLYIPFMALINWLLLVAATQTALQLRISIPIGSSIAGETLSLVDFVILTTIVLCGIYVLSWMSWRNKLWNQFLTPWRQYRLLILTALISALLGIIFLPQISVLEAAYFLVITLIVGTLAVYLPARIRTSEDNRSILTVSLQQLNVYMHLMKTWLRYRIAARYSQTILGIAWIIMVPLSEALVMAFAFTQLLGARDGRVSFVLFILSGTTIFSIFRTMMLRSKESLSSSMSVMKQVYFPREILILLQLGEALVDFFFMFIALVVLSAFFGIYPNINFLLLPIPILLMTCLSLGLSFLFSWLSLQVRDLQQLVGVIVQLLFYATVLLDIHRIEEPWRALVLINPLSAIVEYFRSIIIYNEVLPISVLVPTALISLTLLYLGYVYFKANEDRFVLL